MGARKKTEKIQFMEPPSMSPSGGGYVPARNLSKRDLGGVIFGCKNNTMGECLTKRLFGLPSASFHYVRNIEPGLTLFLFNYSDRKMHGIYEAASPGQMNIDPYAWTNDGKQRTGFPAQVRISFRTQCQPVTEDQFKKVIGENYYNLKHFFFELNHAQTEGLIGLFLTSNPYMNTIIPHAQSSDANLFTTSATTKCNLLANFENVSSRAVKPKRVNELPPLYCNDKFVQPGVTGTTSPTATLENKFREPGSYQDNPIEGIVMANHSYVSPHQERASQTSSEQQFCAEKLENGEVRGHMMENPSANPNYSTFLQKTCINYHRQYMPRNINDRSMFPGSGIPSVSAENENTIRSDPANANAELVQVVKELKERAAALEKKQFESEQEMQQLRNVVKDSGAQIQQLKNCVNDLESKLMQSAGSENVIYLIGGFNGKSWLSTLNSFAPSTDILMPLKSMGSVRAYASASALDGNIFVFGGGDGNSWFDTVECYSPRNDNWTFCSPLIRAKGSLAGATLNGKIFALGGGNGSETFADVEMFDPTLGKWIYNQSMLQKRFAPAAAELGDVLYATGGYDGQDYLHTAERLDPRVGYWTKLSNMKIRRGSHSMAVLNEKLYVMGGFDGKGMVSSVEIFDPRNGSWLEGEPLNLVRGYGAAAVLGGSLFVIGGIDYKHDIVESVECYTEGTGWTSCAHKAIGKRCFFSAVVVP